MRFKKTTIGVTLLLTITFLNQYKRQDVFTLTDQGREVPDCVKVLFFNDFMPNNLPCSVLSGSDARNLLHKIKYEAFRTNDGIVHHPTSRLHGIMGNLCVTPEWMAFLPYTAMPYLRKCIYALYDPWHQLLYLSEDCSELSWDYYEGFCISNVPPGLLGVDMVKIERHFNKHYNRQDSVSSGNEEVAK